MNEHKLSVVLVWLALMSCSTQAYNYQPGPGQQLPSPQPAIEKLLDAGDRAAKAGKLNQAENYYKLAQHKLIPSKKKDEYYLEGVLYSLAMLYKSEKRYHQAIAQTNCLISLEKKMYGQDHIFIAESFRLLGDLEYTSGDLFQAKKAFAYAARAGCKAYPGGYYGCVVAAASNDERKLVLVTESYAAWARCYEREKNLLRANAIYKEGISACAQIYTYSSSKHAPSIAMLQLYNKYLMRHRHKTEALKIQKEIEEMQHMA